MDTSNCFCRIVADVLEAHGVVDVICSPGSRNAPLLIAVSARPGLRKHVVIDERTAAFMALGIAVVSGRPVALICTSGTALLNYAPAVAEAFYQGIPLIIVSADRPHQWIDQDDSQTIRQTDALANFVKGSYDIPAVNMPDDELRWYVNRLVNDAMINAAAPRRGPVHLNVRLAPPLGSLVKEESGSERCIKLLKSDGVPCREQMEQLAAYAASRRVLIVVGFLPPDARLNKAMRKMAMLPSVVLMAETLSNLHLPPENTAVDSLLSGVAHEKLKEFAPDLIITSGGALVSRMIKEYLRDCPLAEHWAVGHVHTTVDCFKSLTLRIEADPAAFFSHLAGRMGKALRSNDGPVSPHICRFKEFWMRAAMTGVSRSEEAVDSAPWSDLKAYGLIFRALPSDVNLFLSNGTSVRYAQILCHSLPHASYCNRGVSGIDGCTSTAVGCAMAYGGVTLLMTGDMSLSYDIGVLQYKDVPRRMRIIVFSNGGGAIFRFIPSTSSLPEREKYFCADPHMNVERVALAFDWGYVSVGNERELLMALPEFLSPEGGRRILEVTTPGEVSADILRRFLTSARGI